MLDLNLIESHRSARVSNLMGSSLATNTPEFMFRLHCQSQMQWYSKVPEVLVHVAWTCTRRAHQDPPWVSASHGSTILQRLREVGLASRELQRFHQNYFFPLVQHFKSPLKTRTGAPLSGKRAKHAPLETVRSFCTCNTSNGTPWKLWCENVGAQRSSRRGGAQGSNRMREVGPRVRVKVPSLTAGASKIALGLGKYVAVVGADETLVEVRAGDSVALIARYAGTYEASSGVDAGGEGVLHTTGTSRVTACQCYSSQMHAGE